MTGTNCRRMLVRAIAGAWLVGFVLGWFPETSAAEIRTWTDKSGQHQIKAKLVRVEGDKVLLEREDGAKVRIELASLSEADRKYVTENDSSNANPFQRVGPPAGSDTVPSSQDDREHAADDERGLAKIDWSSVDTIVGQPSGEWKFTVPEPISDVPTRKKAITLPRANGLVAWFHVIFNRVCRRMLMGFAFDNAPIGRETALVLCDLQSGRVSSCYGSGKMTPLALSDGGDQVLMLSVDPWRSKGDRLELWKLGSNTVQVLNKWRAHTEEEGGRFTVRGAAFLPGGKLATFSVAEQAPHVGAGPRVWNAAVHGVGGKLVIWSLDPLKPLYCLANARCGLPAVSPDGKYIVLATGSSVGVLDVNAGEVVAAVALPEAGEPTFAFSPSGARLAALCGDKVWIWDFATGGLYRTIKLMGGPSAGWVVWTSEGQVLVGNTLFDVEREFKLWQYDGAVAVMFCDGLCWFVVPGSSQQPPVVVPIQIPHPEALRRLREKPMDFGFFVVGPGATVRVVVDGVREPGQREKVRAVLTRKLQANNCKVGEQSQVELVASVERSKPVELYYGRDIFPGPSIAPPADGKAYRFQGHDIRLKFTYRGETIWEASAASIPPSHFRLEQDETIEQHLRQAERPKYEWFETVELPKFLTRSWHTDPLGRSQVTGSGLQELRLPPTQVPAMPGLRERK